MEDDNTAVKFLFIEMLQNQVKLTLAATSAEMGD
jgi:hypothetical protein